MPARTATRTATKREVLKRRRALLDKLPTREAQVLRMRYGLEEPAGAEVAAPPPDTPAAASAKLEAIEGEVRDRARSAGSAEAPESAQAKAKILSSLKKKR